MNHTETISGSPDDRPVPPGHRCGVVALIGPPNAGKSTLLNHYLGQKVAIVSPKPQTTRNRISGILTRDDSQVIFLDTPGVHQGRRRLNRLLVEAAWQALGGADAVLLVLDATVYASRSDQLERDLKGLESRLRSSGLPLVVALNKIDRVRDKAALLPMLGILGQRFPDRPIIPVSAAKGEGTDVLLKEMIQLLPEAPPAYPADQISTVPLRFMASEVVREKLFLLLDQELPYSVAVEVEDWDEDPDRDIAHIAVVVYVARETHKPMVIGRGGQLLKRVGQEARQEIEELLEKRVNLKIWVKVRPEWYDDPGFMTSLGLGA